MLMLSYSNSCNLAINQKSIRPIVIRRVKRLKAKKIRKIHARNAVNPIVCTSIVNPKATGVKKLKEGSISFSSLKLIFNINLNKGVGMGFDYSVIQRNLALELVRVTEAAALAAAHWFGKGILSFINTLIN